MMKIKKRLVFSVWFGLFMVIFLSGYSLSAQKEDLVVSREQAFEKSREHFLQGEALYNEGNFSGADQEFRKAQELLDTMKEGEIDKAKTEKGPEGGVIAQEAGSKKETVDYAGYISKALYFANKGEPHKAISFYLKASDYFSNNADLYYNLAIEYLKIEQFNQAARELYRVIQLNPREKDAYYNLGVLYECYLGDLQQAKFYYTQYVKLAGRKTDTTEVKKWLKKIEKELCD